MKSKIEVQRCESCGIWPVPTAAARAGYRTCHGCRGTVTDELAAGTLATSPAVPEPRRGDPAAWGCCDRCGDRLPRDYIDAGARRCATCAPGWFACTRCRAMRPEAEGCRRCDARRRALRKQRQAPQQQRPRPQRALDPYDDAEFDDDLCAVCAERLPPQRRRARNRRCAACVRDRGHHDGPQRVTPAHPQFLSGGLPTLGRRSR